MPVDAIMSAIELYCGHEPVKATLAETYLRYVVDSGVERLQYDSLKAVLGGTIAAAERRALEQSGLFVTPASSQLSHVSRTSLRFEKLAHNLAAAHRLEIQVAQ